MIRVDELSLTEMALLIRQSSLTSEAITRHYLQTLAERNPAINAVIQKRTDEAILAQAREADIAVSRGQTLGPLHGVPITIKDVLHVKGYRLSRGLGEFLGDTSQDDATAVARLRAAGAIIIGLTNVPELCMAFETDNLIYGLTRNPHNLNHSAGGSSGGEAAAIAAGISPAGLASDACGSVRIPAHFNGVCGFKLTQGRVPLTGQFPRERAGLFHHTSSFGVMGRYVADVEVLGRLITGPDGHDPDTVDVPWPGADKPLDQLRVAFVYETARVSPSPAVARTLDRVRELTRTIVASVSDEQPPMLEESCEVLWRLFITGGDSARGWKQLFSDIGKRSFTPALKGLVTMSEEVECSIDQVKSDWNNLDRMRYQLAAFFRSHDLLITPVHPEVAFEHGRSLDDRHQYGYVFPFSLSGSPALVIRAGIDQASGLPIGIQIVAPHWQEGRLIEFGKRLEAALPKWQAVIPLP
jgi:amidase